MDALPCSMGREAVEGAPSGAEFTSLTAGSRSMPIKRVGVTQGRLRVANHHRPLREGYKGIGRKKTKGHAVRQSEHPDKVEIASDAASMSNGSIACDRGERRRGCSGSDRGQRARNDGSSRSWAISTRSLASLVKLGLGGGLLACEVLLGGSWSRLC